LKSFWDVVSCPKDDEEGGWPPAGRAPRYRTDPVVHGSHRLLSCEGHSRFLCRCLLALRCLESTANTST
jgi:hypothetical protein